MTLSQDIIFQCLSNRFGAMFHNRLTQHSAYGRPIFYDGQTDIADRIVLLAPGVMELPSDAAGALLVCLGPQKKVVTDRCAQISLRAAADPMAVFNTLQALFDSYEAWDSILLNSGAGRDSCYKELVQTAGQTVASPIYLIDREYQYVAYSREPDPADPLCPESDEDTLLPESVRTVLSSAACKSKLAAQKAVSCSLRFGTYILRGLYYDGGFIGLLLAPQDGGSSAQQRCLCAMLDRLAEYTLRLYERHQSFTLKGISFTHLRDLLERCLNGDQITWLEWKDAFAEVGWPKAGLSLLIQFRMEPRYDHTIYPRQNIPKVESVWEQSIGFVHGSKLLLLVKCPRAETQAGSRLFQSLSVFLRENLMVAGVSREFENIYGIGGAFEQTDLACELGRRFAPTVWCHRFDDYALQFLLSQCLGKYTGDPSLICSKKLLTLRQIDATRGTDYCKTLREYLDNGFNATRAAEKLFVHRSTFLERMERIRKLTDIDFSSPDEVLYLQLSLRLLERT